MRGLLPCSLKILSAVLGQKPFKHVDAMLCMQRQLPVPRIQKTHLADSFWSGEGYELQTVSRHVGIEL